MDKSLFIPETQLSESKLPTMTMPVTLNTEEDFLKKAKVFELAEKYDGQGGKVSTVTSHLDSIVPRLISCPLLTGELDVPGPQCHLAS